MVSAQVSDKKIKVLHLIDSGGLYGAEKMLLTLCHEQIKQGLEPTILSCGLLGDEPKDIEREADRLNIPCKVWRMKAGLNVKGMKEIWSYVHREGFTHLHSHGYKFNILLALTKTYQSGVVTVTTVHGYVAPKRLSKMWLNLILDRWALTRIDRVVFVSKAMLQQSSFRSFKNPLVVENGMDFDLFKEPVASSSGDKIVSQLEGSNLIIGYIGRLSAEKGVMELLESFESLRKNYTAAHLLICGDGPLRQDLINRVCALNLDSCVTLSGFIKDVQSALKKIDVFVMPSLTEGMPMVLMEAMCMQKKIIATRVGGMPEMLAGYPAKTMIGDVSCLKAGLAELMSFDTPSESLAWTDRFSAHNMGTAYLSVYIDLVDSQRGGLGDGLLH